MNKYFHGLLLGVSVLPALLIMPAMAEVINVVDEEKEYTGHNGVGGALTNSTGDDISTNGSYSITFVNNKSTDHGAGFYYKNGTSDTSVVFNTNVSFLNNEVLSSATSGSGAGMFISGGNVSLLGDVNTFEYNAMNAAHVAEGRLYKVGGGAIANQSYVKDSGSDAGTVLDAIMVIGKADGSSQNIFTSNTSVTNGGAIMNRAIETDGNATLTINGTTTFTSNSADINGGAIYNMSTNGRLAKIIFNGDTTFTGNSAAGEDTTFVINNYVYGDQGGAIFNGGGSEIVFNNTSSFSENTAASSGGAIDNLHSTITFNDFATFTNNHVNGGDGQGGAVRNKSGTISFNEGVSFVGNTSTSSGSAIYNGMNHLTPGVVNIKGDSLFQSNSGNYTVHNVLSSGEHNLIAFSDGDVTFKNNTGGALWNQGIVTFTNVGDVLFEGNIAKATDGLANTVSQDSGAAISNTGSMTIVADTFTVRGNRYTGVNGKGAAIGNTAASSVFNLTAQNVAFTNNVGGAIYKENDSFTITADEKIDFTGNTASNAAAINNNGNYSQTTLNAAEIVFDGNTDSASYGGAIFNSGDFVKLLADKVIFKNNQANGSTTAENNKVKYGGGAIQNRGNKGSNQVTEIIIGKDANSIVEFDNNISAMNGGAIHARAENFVSEDNKDAGRITINGTTTFSNNKATLNGGAISNSPVNGTSDIILNGNTTFTGNKSTSGLGGAVYNNGNMIFNGDVEFVGNTDSTGANDIYNSGYITFNGDTTIDGGITGTGSLTIANGARLDIGTASVVQDNITLNGTMLATLRDGDAQITATAENGFTGNGVLQLLMANPGEYNVFGGSLFANYEWDESGITTESSVYDLNWTNGGKTVVATVKSVEDIAEQNGLEQDSATAVSGLTQSTSSALNDLGVQIQEKLAEGTPEAKQEVEHITKAIHPETESVVQSAMTSIQHTVANLTSARMATPRFGRNGGDVSFSSRGIWAQGLFNKAKQNEAFHGYTRGIAAGIDGTVNRAFMIGAGYAYTDSDITGSARDTDVKSNTAFIYAQYKPNEWYMNAMGNYTWSQYSEKDAVVTADYDVNSYGGAVATGYDFISGLTPELGLRYIHVDGKTYTNSLGIKSELKSADYMTAMFGTKYGFNVAANRYMFVRPELRAAVKYDVISDKTSATVAMPGVPSYTLNGDRLSRTAGEFGIGLSTKYKELNISLNYDIEIRKDYTSQTGMLKFRYEF